MDSLAEEAILERSMLIEGLLNTTALQAEPPCEVVTVLVRLPRLSIVAARKSTHVGPAHGAPPEEDYGHAGIAVGDDFYDIRGSAIPYLARPHWDDPGYYPGKSDKDQVGLMDVLGQLSNLEDADVLKIELSVCPEEAKAIRESAHSSQNGIYNWTGFLVGGHCTHLVQRALQAGGHTINNPTFNNLPEGILLAMQRDPLRHSCGSVRGKPARVTLVTSDTSLFYESDLQIPISNPDD